MFCLLQRIGEHKLADKIVLCLGEKKVNITTLISYGDCIHTESFWIGEHKLAD